MTATRSELEQAIRKYAPTAAADLIDMLDDVLAEAAIEAGQIARSEGYMEAQMNYSTEGP